MVRPMFELVCALCQPLPAPLGPPLVVVHWPGEALGLVPHPDDLVATDKAFEAPVLPLPRRSPSLGEDWELGEKRRLRLNVTPTPERCAPLLEMTF